MATMTAHQQYSRPSNRSRRQQEKIGEDVALANYMASSKMRHHKQKQLDQANMMPPSAWGYPNMGYPSPAEWAYYQQQYAAAAAAAAASSQQKNGGSYQQPYVPYQYYYPNCHPNLWVDTSAAPRSIHKSTSTPTRSSSPRSSPAQRSPHSRSSISSQHSLSSFHDPRPSRTSSSSSSTVSGASSTEFSVGRRSSVTSIASSVSGMSVSSKRSFSRRIKEVFKGKSESEVPETTSASATTTTTTRVRRRSSIAALSGLFQKHNNVPTVPEEETTDEDQQEALPAPPAPPFVKSSCPTPPRTPTISSNVSTVSSLSSSSSSCSSSGKKKKIQFYPTIQVHETFSSSEYDRRCDTEATCQKLTPTLAVKIKQELNEYKLTDMEVHVESRRYTHFLL